MSNMLSAGFEGFWGTCWILLTAVTTHFKHRRQLGLTAFSIFITNKSIRSINQNRITQGKWASKNMLRMLWIRVVVVNRKPCSFHSLPTFADRSAPRATAFWWPLDCWDGLPSSFHNEWAGFTDLLLTISPASSWFIADCTIHHIASNYFTRNQRRIPHLW